MIVLNFFFDDVTRMCKILLYLTLFCKQFMKNSIFIKNFVNKINLSMNAQCKY